MFVFVRQSDKHNYTIWQLAVYSQPQTSLCYCLTNTWTALGAVYALFISYACKHGMAAPCCIAVCNVSHKFDKVVAKQLFW